MKTDLPARMAPYTERVTECTSASVLCERPTDTRQPLDASLLWYAMAAGLAVVITMAIWTWLERKADRGSGSAGESR